MFHITCPMNSKYVFHLKCHIVNSFKMFCFNYKEQNCQWFKIQCKILCLSSILMLHNDWKYQFQHNFNQIWGELFMFQSKIVSQKKKAPGEIKIWEIWFVEEICFFYNVIQNFEKIYVNYVISRLNSGSNFHKFKLAT